MEEDLRRRLARALARKIDTLVDFRVRGCNEEAETAIDDIEYEVETILGKLSPETKAATKTTSGDGRMIFRPGENEILLVQIFFQRGDPPSVVGVSGPINAEALTEIEHTAVPDIDENIFGCGSGDYLFRAEWQEEQRGDEGRIELPGGYGLVFLEFRPMKETP